MPVLPCPLGAQCHYGEDGGTWKSVDIPFEQARELSGDHVRIAHPELNAPLHMQLLPSKCLETI